MGETMNDDDDAFPHFSARMDNGDLAWAVADANGVSLAVFCRRLKLGWSGERAATHPAPPRTRKSPPQRPSLKLSTFLADGQLAWPVAKTRGISEALFYARLKKGMTPDEVVYRPVMPRGWSVHRR